MIYTIFVPRLIDDIRYTFMHSIQKFNLIDFVRDYGFLCNKIWISLLNGCYNDLKFIETLQIKKPFSLLRFPWLVVALTYLKSTVIIIRYNHATWICMPAKLAFTEKKGPHCFVYFAYMRNETRNIICSRFAMFFMVRVERCIYLWVAPYVRIPT